MLGPGPCRVPDTLARPCWVAVASSGSRTGVTSQQGSSSPKLQDSMVLQTQVRGSQGTLPSWPCFGQAWDVPESPSLTLLPTPCIPALPSG